MNRIESIKTASILMIVLALSACAGVAPTPIPRDTRIEPLELQQPFEFKADFPGGARFKHKIELGIYSAAAKDSGGIYFKGPKLCLSSVLLAAGWALKEDDVNKVVEVADCGVYLPSDQSLPPKVFAVIGSGLTPEQIAQQKANADALALSYSTSGNKAVSGNDKSIAAYSAGGVVGFAVVGLLADTEVGRFNFLRNQEGMQHLRLAFQAKPSPPSESATQTAK